MEHHQFRIIAQESPKSLPGHFDGNHFIILRLMGCEDAMGFQESAFSEITAEILIVGLALVLGIVILGVVFGIVPQIPKSAYISADASIRQMPGYSAIAITHRGGDTASFLDPGAAPFFIKAIVDTSDGSHTVVPDTTTSPFGPGKTVYIYYNGTDYAMTTDLNGVAAVPLPYSAIRVRIVDDTSQLLILDWRTTTNGSPALTATTPIPKTTPAPTATTAVSTRTITVIWSPGTYGYGSEAPPSRLVSSQEIRVPRGSSKTIFFVPNSGYAVLTIKLDGATVYTGSSAGSTISYTVTNILEDRTLIATFG